MAKLHLKLLTPEKSLLSQEVDEVTLPGGEGELGVLPGHTTLITTLGTGPLIARAGGQAVQHQISGGYAEIVGDRVTVLADSAK